MCYDSLPVPIPMLVTPDTITVGSESYRVERNLKRSVNLCTDVHGEKVVVKRYPTPEEYYRARYAHYVWQCVRKELVAVGLPDFIKCEDWYRVSRFVPGHDISSQYFCTTSFDLNITQARDLALMTVDIFHELISRCLSHGDIKPKNIVITQDGGNNPTSVTFIDPDFFHDNAAPYSTRLVFSTPRYVAPELARHDGGYSRTSDLFSFGISLLEASIATPRYASQRSCYYNNLYRSDIGDDYISMRSKGVWRSECMEERLRSAFRPVADKEGSSRAFDQLFNFVFRCLRDDPAARPQSAEEMRQILTDTGNLTQI